MQPQTAELFAGTQSFSKAARQHGFLTWTCDLDSELHPDLVADILTLPTSALPADIDILWASPPCEGFSVAAIGKNWNRDYTPKHPRAELAQALVRKTVELIRDTGPRWWFIENPRGMLRKMEWFEDAVREMGGVRHTVTYCQYGDTRMKPTDIWTNATWWKPKDKCSPGSACHEAAPRGSKTGTQGIVGAKDRGRIPPAIFEQIFAHLPQRMLIAAE